MTQRMNEIQEKVTDKVTTKVAEQISKIVCDKIKEIGEFSCEEMTINLSFKNMKISTNSDNEYQHRVD